MKYSIGSMVDIAGTPWEITKEFGEYLILEHRDGNRVTVPKAMFGPDPGSPQVGDVWLFTPTAEGGGVAYSQGYVQIIGTQDTMNRWPVVYVAERHPEQARLGRFYVWREELVEKAELQVATVEALTEWPAEAFEPLADWERELLNGGAPEALEFVPGRVYRFTQPEQGHVGKYPSGRVVYIAASEIDRWHQVGYVNAVTNDNETFWVQGHELSEV